MYRVRSRFLIFLWGVWSSCGDDSPSSPTDLNQRDVGVDSDAGPIPSNSVTEFDMGGREMDVDVSEVDSGVGMRADMSVENDGELPNKRWCDEVAKPRLLMKALRPVFVWRANGIGLHRNR